MSIDLVLGGVDLLSSANTDPGWWIEAGGDDASLGSPVDVETAVESFLEDGAIVTVNSRDNREMSLPVVIRATSVANLAAGEAALAAELGQRNTLSYTPSGNGATCVFDVVTSSLSQNYDDILEKNAIASAYTLTIKALPWVRSAAAATAAWSSTAAAPTVVSVDACTSTTGWTARWTRGGGTFTTTLTPTTAGGSVSAICPLAPAAGVMTTWIKKSSLSASMTSTPYVRVDMTGTTVDGSSGVSSPTVLVVNINGTSVSATAQNGNVYWFLCPGSTLTTVELGARANVQMNDSLTISAADISRSSQPYDVLLGRQSFRTVQVTGSARTQASIALADATPASLGSVLVHTTPAGVTLAQPNLRARLQPGPTETVDSTAVSGKTNPLSGTSIYFDTPAVQVPPGAYQLLARVKNPAASNNVLNTFAFSVMGSTVQGDTVGANVPFSIVANTWTIIPLGQFTLPNSRMGSSGVVRIGLNSGTNSGLVLDEVWMFNVTLGRLSWVECGTATPSAGGAASRLWLDSASLDLPVPSIVMGTAADRSDAIAPGGLIGAHGVHEFAPPAVNVFTVTSNSTAAAGSLSYYPRWHTRAAA